MWDITISYLSGNARCLKACSLTCRALRQASRKLFWRRPRLQSSAGLESLLSEHPDVAVFVQKLSIHLPLAKLQLLLKLKNLQSLTWSSESDKEDRDRDDTTRLLPWAQGLTFPGVTDLTILWYDDLQDVSRLGLLSCFPSIISLHVRGALYRADKRIVGQQQEELRAIPLSLSRLQYFAFNYTRLVPAFLRIMRATGDSLKSIKLELLEGPDEVTAEFLDISAAIHLTDLEMRLGVRPTSPNWGDSFAMMLQHINSSHQSLNHIILHVPSLFPDRDTGLQKTWEAPGERLGQQLFRVMNDVPDAIITFCQHGSLSNWAAQHAHGTLGHNLQKEIPDLTAFPERLRFEWNIKVWSAEEGVNRMHNEALIQDWQI